MDDNNVTRRVASTHVHVERAIGAMKQWKYLQGRIRLKHLDILPMAVRVLGTLVNLTHPPFASLHDTSPTESSTA